MATLVSESGIRTTLKGDKPKGALSLKQMQKAVQGLIEPIYGQNGESIAICNEEALYKFEDINPHLMAHVAKALGVSIRQIQPLKGPFIIPDKDEDGEWY